MYHMVIIIESIEVGYDKNTYRITKSLARIEVLVGTCYNFLNSYFQISKPEKPKAKTVFPNSA